MSSNIRIINGVVTTPDRRSSTAGGLTTFDDDPADSGGASNPSVIMPAEIDAALHGTNGGNGTRVTISTQSAEGEAGDITLSSPLTYSNTVARTLTLNAADNILLNADIGPSLLAGALNLAFNAASSAFNANSGQPDSGNSAGHVVMGAGVTIDSNGGTINFNAGTAAQHSLQGTIASHGGAVTIVRGVALAGDLSISTGASGSAGNVAFAGNIDSDGLSARTLIVDAREGATGGFVSFAGTIGASSRVDELGIGASSVSFNNSIPNNVGTLALALGGANQGVNLTNGNALTIGSVGAFSGITTNTGNVAISTASGDLMVASAI